MYIGKKLVLPFIEKKDLIVKNKNKNFHIHYTSYYNYSEASKTIQKLSKENKLVFTLPVRQGENLVYRVYIGVFTDKNIAAAYLNKLNFDHLPFL
ncbi:MAG: SPOR domain-containing protein [Desulfobacula sp.]|nr:SPOR domain-containing protein [Desulfobacula sp.]